MGLHHPIHQNYIIKHSFNQVRFLSPHIYLRNLREIKILNRRRTTLLVYMHILDVVQRDQSDRLLAINEFSRLNHSGKHL